jgi:uncharacterized protein YegJ (DUF2314 family)
MGTKTLNDVRDQVLVFYGCEHLWVDAMTGEITRRVPIIENVPLRVRSGNSWATVSRITGSG